MIVNVPFKRRLRERGLEGKWGQVRRLVVGIIHQQVEGDADEKERIEGNPPVFNGVPPLL